MIFDKTRWAYVAAACVAASLGACGGEPPPINLVDDDAGALPDAHVVVDCTGCLVDGVCYDRGAANPSNPCEFCDVATSRTSFAPHVGASCDDGLFCTVSDACSSRGVCLGEAPGC